MREFRISREVRRRLMIAGSLVVLLTWTGPFGTFAVPPLQRLAYWSLIVGGCSLLVVVGVAAARHSSRLAHWPDLPRIALGAMLAAVPGAALVALVEMTLRGNETALDSFLWYWFCVAVIGFLVTLFETSVFQLRSAEPAAEPQSGPPEIRFLVRVPREMGRELISLSMQDHYVRVTTTRGSVMVLIRLSDAIDELAGYPGVRIHRSHWVAAGQARRMLREKNRRMIELVDGRRLPVSRPYLDEARGLVSLRPEVTEGLAGMSNTVA